MLPVLVVIILFRLKMFANDPDFSASNLNVAVTGYNDAAKNVSYSSNILTVKASNVADAPSVNITVNKTDVSGQTPYH